MCTVSIVAEAGPDCQRSVRLACNRDELLTRPVALPPVRRCAGECEAILPIDPISGGTWIAVTSAGLAFSLLNVNRTAVPGPVRQQSRGLIIPQLLAVNDLPQAILRFAQIDVSRFASFRLLVISETKIAEFVWEGAGEPRIRCESLQTAIFFTSSGLGDALVEQPRRAVFERYLVQQSPTRKLQDALHQHRWPARPEISIRMDRPDARTVSYTTLEIGPERVALSHFPSDSAPHGAVQSLSAARPHAVEASFS